MDIFWQSKTHLNNGKYCKRSATGISRNPSKRVESTNLVLPNVIPKNYEIAYLDCLASPARYPTADRSWTVLLDVRITERRSDWMSKPLPGDTSLTDLTWVPGEGSSNGRCDGRAQVRPSLFWGTPHVGATALHFLPPDCPMRVCALAQPIIVSNRIRAGRLRLYAWFTRFQ
jgi:hypothetical protein